MRLLRPFLFFWAAFWLMVGCSDDDAFSSSPHNQLTFSVDTLRLDTVFSAVPTATKTFWVYNRSASSLRLSNVRLEKGNQTGFRVNVDGTYLGATQGYQVSGLELRQGDSLRVFVELTSPMTGKHEPQEMKDNLVFSLESGVEHKVCLDAWAWDAQVLRSHVVRSDTTFAADRPILIYGNLQVSEGATLRLLPGTTLYFHADAGMEVYGRLVAEGTSQENIVMRGDRIDRMFDYLPYDRVSGQWQGIRFHESSYENVLNFVDIHSTTNAVRCDSSDVSRLKLSLLNSIIHNCQGHGVESVNSVVDVENCQVSNTLGDCVAIYGGGALLAHCTIAQFYPFDANRGAALRFANFKGDQLYPLYDFRLQNSLVTGYADDVVMGEADSTVAYSYVIDHCVLRTPEPEKADERITNVVWEDVEDTVSCGSKHFAVFDTDNLYYDFRLAVRSSAIGKADPANFIASDRRGKPRDEEPDAGCYEYVEDED